MITSEAASHELLDTGAKRRHIGLSRSRQGIEIPAEFHKGTGEEAPGPIFMIGQGIDAGADAGMSNTW